MYCYKNLVYILLLKQFNIESYIISPYQDMFKPLYERSNFRRGFYPIEKLEPGYVYGDEAIQYWIFCRNCPRG
uniref:Uma2 domain-containing protein n=1 Tax=Strongyloides stercoralis TaxID=6248 RepID=A0A0K0ENN9_STRER